jgi:hypothetical protein
MLQPNFRLRSVDAQRSVNGVDSEVLQTPVANRAGHELEVQQCFSFSFVHSVSLKLAQSLLLCDTPLRFTSFVENCITGSVKAADLNLLFFVHIRFVQKQLAPYFTDMSIVHLFANTVNERTVFAFRK